MPLSVYDIYVDSVDISVLATFVTYAYKEKNARIWNRRNTEIFSHSTLRQLFHTDHLDLFQLHRIDNLSPFQIRKTILEFVRPESTCDFYARLDRGLRFPRLPQGFNLSHETFFQWENYLIDYERRFINFSFCCLMPI